MLVVRLVVCNAGEYDSKSLALISLPCFSSKQTSLYLHISCCLESSCHGTHLQFAISRGTKTLQQPNPLAQDRPSLVQTRRATAQPVYKNGDQSTGRQSTGLAGVLEWKLRLFPSGKRRDSGKPEIKFPLVVHLLVEQHTFYWATTLKTFCKYSQTPKG